MNKETKYITNVINAAKESVDIMNLKNATDKNGRYDNFDSTLRKNGYIDEYINHVTSQENVSEIGVALKNTGKNSKYEAQRLVADISNLKTARKRRTITYVASIAAALIAVSFLVRNEYYNKKQPIVQSSVAIDKLDVAVPTLTLASGKNIDLNSLNSNTILENGAYQIKVDGKSKLTYSTNNSNLDTLKNNKLVIPKKYLYNITLADGTEVHLNANSELEYPVAFVGDTRMVRLKGEAFFKVTKSNIPFVVQAEGINVKVYGTEFNINTHKKDIIETTLISGSVGVSLSDRNAKEFIIKPNEMFTQNFKTGSSEIKEVDPQNYTAWLTGRFVSIKEPLENLLNKISNCYDVDFSYHSEQIRNITISAVFNNKYTVEKILKIIESTIDIKFIHKEGGKYIVEEIR